MAQTSVQPRDADLIDRVLTGLLAQPDPMTRYRALSRAQQMYESLIKRIAAERARAVAELKQTGLSYGEIAEAIGFTRARAQQLAERGVPVAAGPPLAQCQVATPQLAAFLEQFLQIHEWPREPDSRSIPVPPLMAQLYTTEQLATELFADPGFRALHLASWRRAPDAKRIAAAVDALSPRLYQQDAALLIEGVSLAAQLQQDDGRRRGAAAGVVLAFLGAVSLAGRS